jgi:hypothetical protein
MAGIGFAWSAGVIKAGPWDVLVHLRVVLQQSSMQQQEGQLAAQLRARGVSADVASVCAQLFAAETDALEYVALPGTIWKECKGALTGSKLCVEEFEACTGPRLRLMAQSTGASDTVGTITPLLRKAAARRGSCPSRQAVQSRALQFAAFPVSQPACAHRFGSSGAAAAMDAGQRHVWHRDGGVRQRV